MRNLSVLMLLGSFSVGCANQQASPQVENVPTNVVATTEPNGEAATQDTYPERAEVIRLLHRANAEFDAGRYREALQLARTALGVDPSSVAAAKLRDRINDILVRS